MYPVAIGYDGAVGRINGLAANGHHAEALVTSTFTIEKTLRRTLRQLVISAGFSSLIADKVLGNLRGLDAVKNAWEIYEPRHRKLTDLVADADWMAISESAKMRNDFVHGARVYDLARCQDQTRAALRALQNLKELLDTEYGYSGWSKVKTRRNSRLHEDPKVSWTR